MMAAKGQVVSQGKVGKGRGKPCKKKKKKKKRKKEERKKLNRKGQGAKEKNWEKKKKRNRKRKPFHPNFRDKKGGKNLHLNSKSYLMCRGMKMFFTAFFQCDLMHPANGVRPKHQDLHSGFPLGIDVSDSGKTLSFRCAQGGLCCRVYNAHEVWKTCLNMNREEEVPSNRSWAGLGYEIWD
ncbi:hypothetical protein llap_9151 [Limosa lapponica baueri]|uniref:Uncharacterized protein n=1 Tax=Limosa lapponica baueri TaxID=1758121 RepID=A0A2I0U388_LIMLA|nr:hypothetical protein llap_9151 [Limosa lapponica baueri]